MRTKVLFLFLFLGALNTYAQAPQAVPYQAVARDTSGVLLSNQNISLRFTVHDSTIAGTAVYEETQNVTTNILATFTVYIGTGTPVSGTFSSINWGHNAKYLQVEIDPTGGASFTNMGTQQLLSVPYALYSGTAGSLYGTGGSSPNTLLYTTNGF